MKLTKSQLKQIIKEEVSSYLGLEESSFNETIEEAQEKILSNMEEQEISEKLDDILYETKFLDMLEDEFLSGFLSPRKREIKQLLQSTIFEALISLSPKPEDETTRVDREPEEEPEPEEETREEEM